MGTWEGSSWERGLPEGVPHNLVLLRSPALSLGFSFQQAGGLCAGKNAYGFVYFCCILR